MKTPPNPHHTLAEQALAEQPFTPLVLYQVTADQHRATWHLALAESEFLGLAEALGASNQPYTTTQLLDGLAEAITTGTTTPTPAPPGEPVVGAALIYNGWVVRSVDDPLLARRFTQGEPFDLADNRYRRAHRLACLFILDGHHERYRYFLRHADGPVTERSAGKGILKRHFNPPGLRTVWQLWRDQPSPPEEHT